MQQIQEEHHKDTIDSLRLTLQRCEKKFDPVFANLIRMRILEYDLEHPKPIVKSTVKLPGKVHLVCPNGTTRPYWCFTLGDKKVKFHVIKLDFNGAEEKALKAQKKAYDALINSVQT